jgi:hypothetical protein
VGSIDTKGGGGSKKVFKIEHVLFERPLMSYVEYK